MEDSKFLVDNISKSDECSRITKTNEANSSDTSTVAKFYDPSDSKDTKICTFFSKYKNCKFGENCKFKHYEQSHEQLNFESKHNKNTGFSKRVFVSRFYSNKSSFKPISDRKLVTKRIICRYYKAGNCDKGDHCLYQHSSGVPQYPSENANISVTTTNKKRRVPICHYFKKGNCHRGEECSFYHSPKHEQNTIKCEEEINTSLNTNIENSENNDTNSDVSEITSITTSCTIHEKNENDDEVNKQKYLPNKFRHGRKLHVVSNISDEELTKIRNTEITQLKKRYPKHIISEQESILFTFEPSDPDWPFDLKTLDLEVYFPDKYPIEACNITVVLSSNIPDMLLRHLNQSIKDWIEQRFEEVKNSAQTELMFRPFLKWFDRNLEELFICGLRKVKRDIEAKKDGIEFVPVENLFPSPNVTHSTESTLVETSAENNPDLSEFHAKNINNQAKNVTKHNILLDNSALKQGIKVLFNGLELVEGIATFTCSKLSVTVQCIRCKTSCNIKCPAGRSSSTKCAKCSKVIDCSFGPSIMHQFSNVAGNLHVVECQIVDINLVESCFVIDCLSCSKQITIDGLHYGQKQKRWCTSCSEKLIFSIENVKFQATSSTYIAAKNAPTKKVEKKKDPLFKEGEPLPDFGTCKHYKKSYRWLRFPCCGRLYPCDICHDEKENDHEMKFASRMICGFCSKEQPYSKEKPCSSCSGSMTAKSGSHWEGGKGCRNKIKMARDDKHKYSGTSKTVSKKAQSTKTGKK